MTTKPNLNRVWAAGAAASNIEDPDVTVPGKFDAGWEAEIPPFENFNFLQQLFTQALAHANEYGIMQWDVATVYPDGAWARSTVDDLVYSLKVGGDPSNEPSASPTDWELVTGEGVAADVTYDNATSGLAATDVQGAIDELVIATTEVTGTATFTNATNNIALVGFGAIAGLEVGDVYEVTGTSSNNKIFTVEVITDADNVIVNQAHAGGTTTKSLVNETVACTLTLVSKWYNAPMGLGQGSADVLADRAVAVTYVNSTNRTIGVSVVTNATTSGAIFTCLMDGLTVTKHSDNTGSKAYSSTFIVPVGSSYSVSTAPTTIFSWKELT